MTQEQKQYIEKNVDLMINNKWEEFFKNAPNGIGEPLYMAGIDFMEQMKQVPDFCFGSSSLTNIDLPNNITSIGSYAFYYCTRLTSVTIGNGVTSIGSSAFEDCTGLTTITIPDSVTSIGDDAFSGCTGLTTITIPDSVTSISYAAFNGCTGLTSVTLGSGVKSIEPEAFSYITSDLVINFNGTKDHWKNIYNSNSFRSTNFKVNCLDGVVHKR